MKGKEHQQRRGLKEGYAKRGLIDDRFTSQRKGYQIPVLKIKVIKLHILGH